MEQFLEFVDVGKNARVESTILKFVNSVCSISHTTLGVVSADTLLQRIYFWGLDLGKLRGQRYDGDENMAGRYKAV